MIRERRASTPSAPPPHRHRQWRVALWAILCLIPVLAAFVLQWLPIFNGPYLFLGLPTILWVSTLAGSAFVTVVLLVVERSRADSAQQHRLDEAAIAEAPHVAAAHRLPDPAAPISDERGGNR